jgi:hypothetical protein
MMKISMNGINTIVNLSKVTKYENNSKKKCGWNKTLTGGLSLDALEDFEASSTLPL